jgi:branched-chain amino acid aminotransferase
MKVYIDGKFYDKAKAKVSVFDHGLLYGDGVFEGIRAYHGRVFKLQEHVDRLYCSAKAILLTVPLTPAEMSRAIVETCRKNKLRDGYIRLLVTRGEGTLGLDPNRCPKASVIIIAGTIQLYPKELYEQGMAIITVPTVRNLHSALSPAIKSLNYLNNIMAKIEAIQANALEAVMLNEQGYVAECTGDNLFAIKNGTLHTPLISDGALNGITRAVIIELAATLGIPVVERSLTRYDIFVADECFLTGTAAEVIPMVSLDRRKIGDGQPGPLTRRLIEAFKTLANSTGTPIR